VPQASAICEMVFSRTIAGLSRMALASRRMVGVKLAADASMFD